MTNLTAGLGVGNTLLPDQKVFVRTVISPEGPTRVIWSNAFGNGKSVAMAIAANAYAQKYPGCLIYYGRQHIKHFYDMNMRTFFTVNPKHIWKYKIYGGRKPEQLVYPNGSVIMFVGYADPSAKLGGEPNLVCIEECSEVSLDMWNYLEGRVRGKNVPKGALRIIGVGNPRGHYPLYRKFVRGEGVADHARKDYLWYKGDPHANRKNLPEGYYERMLAAFPKELRERFVMGSDDTHAGQVFSEFNRDIHATESFNWQDHWEAWVGLDYGRVDPTVALFIGLDMATLDVYVIGEHYAPNMLIPAHVQCMDEMAAKLGFPKEEAHKWADNNIAATDGGNGRSLQGWFGSGGWHFNLAAKRDALQPGIEKIKGLLCPLNGALPRLHIHPRCVHTIEEFQMYEWDTPRNPVEMMRFKETPKEDYNHCMDALRYAINAMPSMGSLKPAHQTRSVWGQIELLEQDGNENKAIVWNPQNVPPKPVPTHPKQGIPRFPLRDF